MIFTSRLKLAFLAKINGRFIPREALIRHNLVKTTGRGRNYTKFYKLGFEPARENNNRRGALRGIFLPHSLSLFNILKGV